MATGDSVTGPINIGNPTEFSILELASMVIEMIGARSKIVRRPLPEDDPKQRRPDISRAQEIFVLGAAHAAQGRAHSNHRLF